MACETGRVLRPVHSSGCDVRVGRGIRWEVGIRVVQLLATATVGWIEALSQPEARAWPQATFFFFLKLL